MESNVNESTHGVEQWKPIPGWDGFYEASDLGRVRSVPRFVDSGLGRRRHYPGRILHQSTNSDTGRRIVTLSGGGNRRTVNVHQLVLSAFAGPRPIGMEACHNDGDCLNNVAENLRWDTASANHLDAVRHGTHNHSRKTHCPRSHLLEEPNLVPSGLTRGKRSCLSCHRARVRLYRKGTRSAESTLRALADDLYRCTTKE